MFRSPYHCFWHDDPNRAQMQQEYGRRIADFENLANEGRALLCVRAIASVDDLLGAGELMAALTAKFGEHCALLLIADFQTKAQGPHVVDGFGDMVIYFLEGEAHQGDAPYRKAVECGLGWIKGDPFEAKEVSSLKGLTSLADPTDWGLYGPCGFRAFEDSKESRMCFPKKGDEMQPTAPIELMPGFIMTTESSHPTAENTDSDVAIPQVANAPSPDDVVLVSLGSYDGTKRSFEELGHSREALPFDSVRTRIEGILHFLQSGCEEFFDVTTAKTTSDKQTVSRGYYHSFWNEDPAEPSTREKYRCCFERLEQLRDGSKICLFVRVIASTDELEHANALAEAIQMRFGEKAGLLLIVDFQTNLTGPSIISSQHGMLVYLLGADAHVTCKDAPYCEPIQSGLAWVAGQPLQACIFPDIARLRQVVTSDMHGLDGPGGLRAFADHPPSVKRGSLDVATPTWGCFAWCRG